jgi:uncharacterized RDD family membrane protein YckC
MVGSVQLAYDIGSLAVSVTLPGLLWGSLFLLAWSHPAFAESVGLGRKSFWLLVPGALLASLAFLPIGPVANDWLAVSFSGAVFPLLIGGIALGRYAPPLGRSLGTFLLLLTVASAALFVVVLPSAATSFGSIAATLGTSYGTLQDLLVTAIAAGFALVVGAWALRSRNASTRAIAFLFAIVAGTLVLTFVGSSAIPGVGIAETFPYFLLPPLGAGFAAGIAAPRVFPREEGFALPVAYFGATFGVLLGADLLREPPLYGHGSPGLYIIGGAGVLDLVYLSGLIALGAAYLIHALAERGWTPLGPPRPEPELTPVGYLDRAFRAGADGHLPESIGSSVKASRAAAAQCRQLLGVEPAADASAWRGLPVPGWVVGDEANLEAVAASGTTDTREAFRAWLMARQLVAIGRRIAYPRFASIGQRIVAFAVDLALVSGVGIVAFLAIAMSTGGDVDSVLSSVGFNAAIYGFVAFAFLYFAFTEAWVGRTVGKRLVGIAVADRALRPPGRIAALVRNAPIAPMLTFVGLGVAVMVAIAVKGLPGTPPSLLGVGVSFGALAVAAIAGVVLGAIALLGAVGVFVILVTTEHQRVGDLWAGTWVVRWPTPTPTGPARPVSVEPGRSA